MDYRFIRIERLDAASSVKLPIVMKDVSSSMAIQMQNPYPAPLVAPIGTGGLSTLSPYPAP